MQRSDQIRCHYLKHQRDLKFQKPLSNKLNNVKQEGKAGGQIDLNEKLFLLMVTLAKWKVPLDDFLIRCLVKAYLDREKIIHKRFKDNVPGV